MLIVEIDGKVYLPINDVADKIWKDKRYRKAILEKAYEASKNGELYRVPPCVDDVYTPMEEVIDYLWKFCHRDNEAKRQLQQFDFDQLEEEVRQAVDRNYKDCIEEMHGKIAQLHREIDDKKRKRGKISSVLTIKKSRIDTPTIE
jgi:FtsZ-binding cell division protein ZapB